MHRCFFKESKFKKFCSNFVQIFGGKHIMWNGKIRTIKKIQNNDGKKEYQYIKDHQRSKNLLKSLIKCLNTINNQLLNHMNCNKNSSDLFNEITVFLNGLFLLILPSFYCILF